MKHFLSWCREWERMRRQTGGRQQQQHACGGEQSASQGRDEVLDRKNCRLWELTAVWQKSSLSPRRRCSTDNRAKLLPKGDNLFPDLQMAIFSFEPRRGSLGLPAPIVFQQGARKSCQLIPPLFQSTERLSAFNYHPIKRCLPFIYRLWFRAYTYCLGIRRNKGVKSLERSLCMGCLIPSPQQQALCCVHRVTATTKRHYMQLNSCSADAPAQRRPIQKEKKNEEEIPFTAFTQKHTEGFPGVTFAWQNILAAGRCDERLKNWKGEEWKRTADSLAASQSPVQTKSWTCEPGGRKLKVWLPVGSGLLEVTSGKCSCLTHFTAYGHLTSDFLTGFLLHADTENVVWFLLFLYAFIWAQIKFGEQITFLFWDGSSGEGIGEEIEKQQIQEKKVVSCLICFYWLRF